jgi:O-antigen ligase
VILLFLASLASLFPGLALPVGFSWKTVSAFDAVFAIVVVVAIVRRDGRAGLDRRLILAALAVVAAGCVTLWVAPSPAGFRTVVTNSYSMVVLVVAAHLRLDAASARRGILWPLSITLAVAWATFIIENAFGIPIGDNRSTALPHGPYRLGGLTGGNALILFLAMGAPLARQVWLAQVGFLISGYATLSRAVLGLGAGVLLAQRRRAGVAASRPRALVRALAVCAVVLGVLTYWFAVTEGGIDEKGRPSVNASLETGTYRVFNTAALRMFRDAPLLGHGPGAFLELFHTYTSKAEQELVLKDRDPYWDPHSAILGLAAEQGLLGLAAFTWLMIEVFFRLRKAPDLEHRDTAAIAIASLLIAGHVVDWIPLKGLWLWMGILVSASRDQPSVAREQQ